MGQTAGFAAGSWIVRQPPSSLVIQLQPFEAPLESTDAGQFKSISPAIFEDGLNRL
jgi:hypothetical protein